MTKTRTAVAEPEAVAPPAEDPAAELARLRADNEKLHAIALEALKRQATAATPAPEPVALPLRKLLFIGQRPNKDHGHLEPDLQVSPSVDRPFYTSGRLGSPLVFKGTDEDSRPHSFIHQSGGDWLIQNDAPRDPYGNRLAERYAWAD